MGIAIVELPESHANVSRHERLAPEAVFLVARSALPFCFLELGGPDGANAGGCIIAILKFIKIEMGLRPLSNVLRQEHLRPESDFLWRDSSDHHIYSRTWRPDEANTRCCIVAIL